MKIRLLQNFTFLGIIHFGNLFIPIIIMPYIIKTIGLDKFGIVMLAQSVMAYITVITDYGFNISAVNLCSVNRESTKKLGEICSLVFSTKLLLSGICFLVFVIVVKVFLPFLDKSLFFLTYLMVIGKTMLPIWFFQGIENLKIPALITLSSKILLLLLIIINVNSKEDYLLVNFFFAVSDILSSIACILVICYHLGIKIKLTPFIEIFRHLKSDFPLLLTNISIVSYGNINILILGMFVSPLLLGAYAVAEKIIISIKFIVGVILQSTFAYASKCADESRVKFNKFAKQEFITLLFLFITLTIAIFTSSTLLSRFFLRGAYTQQALVSHYLRIMCVIPLIVALNIPAYQGLLIFQHKKYYTIINLSGAILNILLNLLFASQYGVWGTILTICLTESFITICLHIASIKKRVLYW